VLGLVVVLGSGRDLLDLVVSELDRRRAAEDGQQAV
jgi:hypothetical protein